LLGSGSDIRDGPYYTQLGAASNIDGV